MTFSGKHALVLGGSCELALALADRFIETGIRPFLTYRSEAGRQRIEERLISYQGKFETVYFDFGKADTINTLFAAVGEELDYLVDFAQGNYESYIASADEDMVARYIHENVAVRSSLLKEAGRLMLARRKGRLVFVSSTGALWPNHGQGFYAATKLAAEALYKNMGLELGKRGITAVTLRPGYVYAGRGRLFIQKNEIEILNRVPTGQVLSSEEIAAAIMFLLSDGAAGFNATELTMDGGLTAGKQLRRV
jgi:3-oxoacyl-[acyl-carrier protein] reductase